MGAEKRCNACSTVKPIAEFHPDSSKKGGYATRCKACNKAQCAAYRERTVEDRRAYDRERYAADPEKRSAHVRLWEEKNADRCKANRERWLRSQPEGYKSAIGKAWYEANRETIRAKQNEARSANPEKWRAINRQWHRENRDIARASCRAWYAANKAKHKAISIACRAAKPDLYALLHRNSSHRRRARQNGATMHKFSAADIALRVAAFGDKCAYCGADWAHLDHVKPLFLGGPHCLSNLRPACVTCNSKKHAKPALQWLAKIDRPRPLPLP